MAGVVAMASGIEDFESQPCKKSRKDGGSPVVKTITNYFSPVPKPVEKPFSPPRSNNIMDYFSRKTPSSTEKTTTPEKSKENCQRPQSTEKPATQAERVKKPGKAAQKQGRKRSKAARRLQDSETVGCNEENNCLVIEDSEESGGDGPDLAGQSVSTRGILGSDTAALLAQLSAEACVGHTSSRGKNAQSVGIEKVKKDEQHEQSQSKDHVKLESKLNCNGVSPVAPSKDKLKATKRAVTKRSRKHQQEDPPPEAEVTETEQSLCNVSMEVNMGDASQLNGSTVTVSFEDFLQSQGEEEKEDKGKEESNVSPEELEMKQLGVCKADGQEGSGTPSSLQQVSPRTLTIQAEVHVVSPKHEPVKPAGKMASMFSRRKGSISPTRVESSPQIESNDEPPAAALPVKRKSNVVILEEDLELAELSQLAEVDSQSTTAKCSQAERKQFMSAFKQPSVEGAAKAKPGKGQSKQKQPAEETTEAVEKEDDEDVISVPSVEQSPVSGPEKKGAKNKALRKGKRRRQKDEETLTDPASPVASAVPVALNEQAGDKETELASPSTPSSKAVRRRRPRREASLREAPQAKTSTPSPACKTKRSKERTKNAASSQDSPVQMSTPKTPRSRFKAEMVCPADDQCSPIRMKFTRVLRNRSVSEGGSDVEILSPLATKTSEASKRRKRAKKLVEKAKVIQQGKESTAKDTSSLRRSSRAQVSTKKIYHDDENSLICMEDDSTPKITPEKSKSQKRMRSMNDVLGKPAPVSKDTKPATGSKVAPLFQGKKPPKPSAVVSIFDDSSHEGSDNSQDGEQFRARREFLKSGLPESFKKQMAKTIATKEAYSLSCSYFQPVVHVLQPPKDCSLWNLLWPESSLLRHLKELWCLLVTRPLPSLPPLSSCWKTEPASRAVCERVSSGWRAEFSECVRQLLMEEVRAYNPPFPVQSFFTRFLKRHSDHLQLCTASEPEAVVSVAPAQAKGGKRKRLNEGETTGKVAKKRRSSRSEEEQQASTPEPELCKRRGRMSRVQRLQMEEKEEEEKPSTPLSPLDDSVIVLDSSPVGGSTGKEAGVKDDVLWTEKYHPQHSSDIIGNTASVRRLHSWLKEWKLRADREERKKQKDKKPEDGGNDSDWDGGEEGEDMMTCNTLLITGPTGVGKTAAVYACAQELGFKVFEVNSSSQRSGRLILSQLKEATQSHQVDIQGASAYKPTYFNSYAVSSSAGSARLGSSPRKVNSPRRVVSSPRKAPQSPRGAKRGNLAPTTLANFFKVGQPVTKEPANTEKTKKTVPPKKPLKEKETASKSKEPAVKPPATTAKPTGTAKATPTEEQSKKTATSLILFEEVDVIFDDDSGFLAAIKTFMTTTKRPVILTTSDPNFSTMFDGFLEEIHFKVPSVVNVGSYLQLLCLAEGTRTDPQDVRNLLTLNGCDIRQSLLQLQFWTRSAGGRHITRPPARTDNSDTNAEVKPEDPAVEAAMSTLPPCESGCTESMLGLLNIEPDRDIQQLLKSQCSDEASLCCDLLMDSKRRTVDLLRSNMETLLPLPLSQLTPRTHAPQQSVSTTQDQATVSSTQDQATVSTTQDQATVCTTQDQASVEPQELDPPSRARLLQASESSGSLDEASPVKLSNRMKNKRHQHCLQKRDRLDSDSDSEDGFLSLCRKPQGAPQTEQSSEEPPVPDVSDTQSAPVKKAPVKRVPLTPDQKRKAVPISCCLGSIAEFLDHMSYLDSSLSRHTLEAVEAHRRMLGLPACAEVKAGMTDEPRVEINSWVEGERALEIQAAVEALSFRRCQSGVAEAWREAQELEGELGKEAAAEFTLPVAPHREGFSLTQDSPCQPIKLQKRRELMECLLSRGAFGTLGNRPAAAVEYLPILRTICKSEQQKEQDKVKRRFLHYLDGIHLGLPKSTVQLLAEDFP